MKVTPLAVFHHHRVRLGPIDGGFDRVEPLFIDRDLALVPVHVLVLDLDNLLVTLLPLFLQGRHLSLCYDRSELSHSSWGIF